MGGTGQRSACVVGVLGCQRVRNSDGGLNGTHPLLAEVFRPRLRETL